MSPTWDGLHFVGVAGTGMSALAQFLAGRGHRISGSDRQFAAGTAPRVQTQLEAAGISCHAQDGSGIGPRTSGLVLSTAIEEGNADLLRARELGLSILHRSELLQNITAQQPTIAVSGTSGKSTVTAMIWHILEHCGQQPSLISGAGLAELEARGLIGNAVAGQGKWLVIEADESDGTLVRYHPEVGLILNLDKDHKEISELQPLFATFAAQVRQRLIVNAGHPLAAPYSRNPSTDFAAGDEFSNMGSSEFQGAGFQGAHFQQSGAHITFKVHHGQEQALCTVPVPGRHNMENALAAIATCVPLGLSLQECASALESYGGIHRRHQILSTTHGITLVDDFAHNPAKIAASIRACQGFASGRVLAWFQPHGFGPTRFLRRDLVTEMAAALRPQDSMWFSRIYYAGGTAVQDISAGDLAQDLQELGVAAHHADLRADAFAQMADLAQSGDVILLMGARDPSLGEFARECVFALEKRVPLYK